MSKHLIQSIAAFALICGAPLLQAQVLGGAGGLGGSLAAMAWARSAAWVSKIGSKKSGGTFAGSAAFFSATTCESDQFEPSCC